MKCWENFRNFSKCFFRKLRKCIVLTYFQKNLTNNALIFCAFGRKTQIVGKIWENFENFWCKFYRKTEFIFCFYFYFGKFVTKNRAFGNNTIFYNFFLFLGAKFPPFPPGYALSSEGFALERKTIVNRFFFFNSSSFSEYYIKFPKNFQLECKKWKLKNFFCRWINIPQLSNLKPCFQVATFDSVLQ